MSPGKRNAPTEVEANKQMAFTEHATTIADSSAQDNPGEITRYGATQNDWDHFDLVLELTDDLLPVVSDPNAVKSPLSKIQGPGKTPSYFNRKGEMVGFPDWTRHPRNSKVKE